MRVFFKAASTITDLSVALRDYKTTSASLTYATGNYLYIGNDIPFNHFFVKMGTTLNLVTATMTIEYWSGDEWVEVVEVNDETNSLKNSGFVEFVPDKDEAWERESTNYRGESVDDLETVVVYDLYWLRISFDQTLTAAISLNWIGNLFCDDNDLYGEYPIFRSTALLTGFETSKTTWEEQRVVASEVLIKDLKSQGVIFSAGQILRRGDYRLPCISKTAQIIYNGMGDDYKDDLIAAKNEYKERLNLSIHMIDANNDGILEPQEKIMRTGFLSR